MIGNVHIFGMILLVVAGCHHGGRQGAATQESPRMRDVCAGEFELEYFAPRTPLSQWRYRGVVDGYHVLDYYGRSTETTPELYHSIRAHTYDLPKDFPSKSQPVVKTFLSKEDQVYFDTLGRKILYEKQRRGENGID